MNVLFEEECNNKSRKQFEKAEKKINEIMIDELFEDSFLLTDNDRITNTEKRVSNSSESSNTKGNKYHVDDGQFTFAPYKTYKHLESVMKTKLIPMRKSVEKGISSKKKFESEEFGNYIKMLGEELLKIQREVGCSEEEMKKSRYGVKNWESGDGMTTEEGMNFDSDSRRNSIAFQCIIDMSKSIMKEAYPDGLDVYRYHFFDEDIPYMMNRKYKQSELASSKCKSFTTEKNGVKLAKTICGYEDSAKNRSLQMYVFESKATHKNIVLTPDIMIATSYINAVNEEKRTYGRELSWAEFCKYNDNSKFYTSQQEYAISTKQQVSNKDIKYDSGTGKFQETKNNSLNINAHFSEDGVIDDYGQYVESKISARKQQFLSEIKSIQLEAINNAISHLTVNELSEENITTKKERTTIFDKLYEAIKKYWLFLVPIIGSNRLQEDEENTQYKRKSPINLLGTSWIQKDIDKNAGKAAKSHTDTIYKTIVNAGKKAEEKIFSRLFADYYKKKYDENPEGENQFFKTEPTITQIKSKLKNPEFVSKNQDIIDFVRKEIEEGKHVQEIQKEIRSTYSTLSNGRAKTLVNTETSRATVRSQYDADYEFLKNIGKLDKAYKVLESNTGDPCPICAAIISKGEVPFTKEFVELGDSVTVSEGDKSITMTFDYEPVEAGCIHPNCHCSYRLMIK